MFTEEWVVKARIDYAATLARYKAGERSYCAYSEVERFVIYELFLNAGKSMEGVFNESCL